MATTFINPENMLDSLKAQMNAEMMAAAEPVIQEALKKAEMAMRQRLGGMFVALIDKSFTMERGRNELVIRVQHNLNPV